MHISPFKALLAALFVVSSLTSAVAQNATLVSDDAEGIVIRFEFSDPI